MLSDYSPRFTDEQPGSTPYAASYAEPVQSQKRRRAFVFLLVAVSLLLGGLSFLSEANAVFFLQMAGFFALGYLHALILRTNVAGLSSWQKMVYSLVLAGAVFLVLLILFFFKGNRPWLFLSACGCAFVLPFVVSEASELFNAMFSVSVPTWRYDADLPLQKSTTFLNSMPLQFRIETAVPGEEEKSVVFRAPVRMKLGTIFYHTVQEANANGAGVQFLNPQGQPYQWTFSVTHFGWSQYLNPELGLIENGVKPNAVITARQLKN